MEIITICFVLHLGTVHNGMYDCFGMKNAFYVHFKKSLQNGILSDLPHYEHSPFVRSWDTSGVASSFSHLIWCMIISIEIGINKILSRVAQLQAPQSSITVAGAADEFWQYLQSAMHPVTIHMLKSMATQKICWPDLSLESKSRRYLKFCIQVASNSELEKLHEIFGARFGISIKHLPPQKGAPVMGCNSENVNMVVPEDSCPNFIKRL